MMISLVLGKNVRFKMDLEGLLNTTLGYATCFFTRKLAEKKSTRFPKQTLEKSIFTARIEVFTHFSDYELGNETLFHGSMIRS